MVPGSETRVYPKQMDLPKTTARALTLLALALVAAAAPAGAQDQSGAAEESAGEATATPEPKAAEVITVTAKDVCRLPDLSADSWIDRMQRAVYRSVCGSAFWFDSFFGAEDAYRERDETFGRAGLGLVWSQHDHLDLRGRFKAKINLPRLEKRLNAFLGTYKKDEFQTDRTRTFQSVPEAFEDTTDQEWLIGLGYSPVRGGRHRIDFDAGVKLNFPLDPFVRTRFSRYHFLSEESLVRFRQTLFWRGEKGFGTTSQADFERVLGKRFHLRWRNVGTVAQQIEGVDWETRLTFYQYLGGSRALAYEAGYYGESDAAVPVKSLDLWTVYRQSAFREWFFVEVRLGVAWPRDETDERREKSYGVGVGFELLFGDYP